MLKRNPKEPSTTVKSQTYKTIVRPQLEYASAIWDPHTANYMYNINKIQNHVARWVHHDYSHYTSVSFSQIQLNYPTLSFRRLQSRLVLFYKICQNKIAIPISPYLQIPLRTTRHTSKKKQKQLQMQTTQHINRHIQIQILPPNSHKLEFTATQSVFDSNGAGLQERPNPSSPPQPVTHM